MPRRSLVCAVAMAAAGCSASGREAQLLNHDPAVAYVGEASCTRCHAEIAASHARTGMGRSAYPLTRETAIEDFAGRNEFHDAETGLRYRMIERDGRYWMRQYLLDEHGRESHVDEREMQLVIGSGNHSRSYVTSRDGGLYQMPVCWYPEGALWDYCPGYERRNGHFAREITESCVFCHNGRMEVVEGQENVFRQPIPHGIDCERCHGPGELHVARWSRTDETPTGGADPTIVNPRRLPAARRIEVCLQCHLGDASSTERVRRHGAALADWRPGQPLTAAVVPVEYREANDEFGLSAQGERMLRSRCFRESGGRLECLTCHNPHVTVYAPERPADHFRERCLGCHETDSCTGPAAQRQATTPPDDCTTCHMPRRPVGDHPHARFTDHWIRRSPGHVTERASLQAGPVLPESFATLSPAERAYHAGRGMFGLSTDHPPGPQRDALLAAAERALRSAQQGGFGEAEGWLVLAKTLRAEGRLPEAADALRTALDKDPGNEGTAMRLGRTLRSLGRLDEARAVFQNLLDHRPDSADALTEIAALELAANRAAGALAACDRAERTGRASADTHGNRALALERLGRTADALAAIEEALRQDPEDVQAWVVHAALAERAGRSAEARRSHDRAVLLRDLQARRAAAQGGEGGDDGAAMGMD